MTVLSLYRVTVSHYNEQVGGFDGFCVGVRHKFFIKLAASVSKGLAVRYS
jgi:hypothetical protein